MIENADYGLRKGKAHPDWPVPRPGHADPAGRARYGSGGFAPAAERASARSTAGVGAVGACPNAPPKAFGIHGLGRAARRGRG